MFKPALAILAFIICFVGCKYPSDNIVSSTKSVDRFTVIIDTIRVPYNIDGLKWLPPHVVIEDENHNHHSYLINNGCNDDSFDLLLNQKKFNLFYIRGDTLIGVTNNKYFYLSDKHWKPSNFKPKYGLAEIYQDELYIVKVICCGEFGGSVFFYNKKNGITYSCPATCVSCINKASDGTFYITTQLGHMGGGSNILRIKDPTKLLTCNPDTSKYPCNWWDRDITLYKNTNKDTVDKIRKHYYQGTEEIIDLNGKLLLNSIVVGKDLYSIYTHYGYTYLGKINGDKLILIDTLFNTHLSIQDLNLIHYNNYSYCTEFHNGNTSHSILYSNKDTIKLMVFK